MKIYSIALGLLMMAIFGFSHVHAQNSVTSTNSQGIHCWTMPGHIEVPCLTNNPSDATPKEWDEPHTINNYGIGGMEPPLPPTSVYVEHHVECEDKTRFKLMSEDGKWHCLRLP